MKGLNSDPKLSELEAVIIVVEDTQLLKYVLKCWMLSNFTVFDKLFENHVCEKTNRVYTIKHEHKATVHCPSACKIYICFQGEL